MSLTIMTFPEPDIRFGLGGNYYVLCDDQDKLKDVCEAIGKSTIAIYFNRKYECFTLRIKSRQHKSRIITYFLRQYLREK